MHYFLRYYFLEQFYLWQCLMRACLFLWLLQLLQRYHAFQIIEDGILNHNFLFPGLNNVHRQGDPQSLQYDYKFSWLKVFSINFITGVCTHMCPACSLRIVERTLQIMYLSVGLIEWLVLGLMVDHQNCFPSFMVIQLGDIYQATLCVVM